MLLHPYNIMIEESVGKENIVCSLVICNEDIRSVGIEVFVPTRTNAAQR
jgi:hypothetical protein